MLYRKFIDSHTLEAPPKNWSGDGEYVINFDQNPDAMSRHGYYPCTEPEPPEGERVASLTAELHIRAGMKTITETVVAEDEAGASVPVTREREIEVDTSYITAEYEYEPIPVPDTSARDLAEKDIVQVIVGLATRYDAINALAGITDITIPSLLGLATQYGVTSADMQEVESKIAILALHLEAVTGMTWAMAWNGLKSRFAGYMQELLNNQGE